MADEPKQILTTAEAAELLGVSPQTVVNYADAGKLACFKLPKGHRRFHRSDVLELTVTETERAS